MQTGNTCEICDKSFSSKYTLNSHQKIHAERQRTHKCECGKNFLTAAHLTNHQKTVHKSERHYTCSSCSKTFKSLNNLLTHEVIHLDKSFLCRFCEKTFSRLQDVKIHEKIHKNQKDFVCQQCSKAFSQQSNLLSHVKTVSSSVVKFEKVFLTNFHFRSTKKSKIIFAICAKIPSSDGDC